MNVERVCPLCHGTNEVRVFAASNIDFSRVEQLKFTARKFPEYRHPQLLECIGCDVLFASPVWSKHFIDGAYQEAGFHSRPESYFASFTYQRLVDQIIRRLPDCDSALDIGTGDGVFLERLLERGFTHVYGVEPSIDSVRAAKPHIGKLIRTGPFAPEHFGSNKFSLITCFHVMEHFWDPLAFCRDVRTLLKPGGVFITVIHDRQALSARILGKRSPIFDIEHLQLFSQQSGRCLLDIAGYRGVIAMPIWNKYPMHYWVKLLPFPSILKRALMAAARPFGPLGLAVSLPAGNVAIVGMRETTEDSRL